MGQKMVRLGKIRITIQIQDPHHGWWVTATSCNALVEVCSPRGSCCLLIMGVEFLSNHLTACLLLLCRLSEELQADTDEPERDRRRPAATDLREQNQDSLLRHKPGDCHLNRWVGMWAVSPCLYLIAMTPTCIRHHLPQMCRIIRRPRLHPRRVYRSRSDPAGRPPPPSVSVGSRSITAGSEPRPCRPLHRYDPSPGPRPCS